MKRILLTGVSGALGWYIKDCLTRRNQHEEFEIHCVSRSPIVDKRVTHHKINILYGEDLTQLIKDLRPSVVFLTAWETKHATYWEDPSNIVWADQTIRAIKAAYRSGVRSICFAGTCAEYPWEGELLDDALPPSQPATLYGREKLRVSNFIANLSTTKDMAVSGGRLFFPYSGRENSNRITSQVARAALENQNFHLAAGDVLRDIYPTSYAAETLVNLALGRARGVYNISSGQPQHLGEFLNSLARSINPDSHVAWDDYQADHGPKTLVGCTHKIKPYLPANFDPKSSFPDYNQPPI